MKGKLVGMLIIYVEKNSAYDGSVAVCPEYKKICFTYSKILCNIRT